MKNSNQLIRIREIKGDKTELTFKGKAQDKNNVWHRKEINLKIDSVHNMEKILLNLGLKKISEYQSQKEYWKLGNLEIVFAHFTVPTELTFMEIEGPSEKEIRQVVEQLGDSVKEAGEEIFEIFDQIRKKT